MSISNARRRLPRISDKLVLNAIAVLGVVVGLLNTALAWAIYGTNGNADVWMLSFVVVQAFVLLSQVGVEQYAIFSAEHRAVSEEAGLRFDQESLLWSVAFGAAFAALLQLLLPYVVSMFAGGFSARSQLSVRQTVTPLLLQVATAPMLYVLRQQLLLKGRARLSVLLNSAFSLVQLVVLATGWLSGELSPSFLALFVGVGSVAAAVGALFSAGAMRQQFAVPSRARLWPFIRASAALRFTHSVHNFLVVLLTNSALSGGVPGTVSLFQYVKKVADGLSSVAVGPHLLVYHAAQANAWATSNQRKFHENIRDYLGHAVPLMAFALGGVLISWRVGIEFFPALAQKAPAGAFWIFVTLSAWQVLISLESIAAGVLVVGKHTRWLLAVNGLFALNFYLIMRSVIVAPYTGLTVASLSLFCQCISSTIISFLAYSFYNKKFVSLKYA